MQENNKPNNNNNNNGGNSNSSEGSSNGGSPSVQQQMADSASAVATSPLGAKKGEPESKMNGRWLSWAKYVPCTMEIIYKTTGYKTKSFLRQIGNGLKFVH